MAFWTNKKKTGNRRRSKAWMTQEARSRLARRRRAWRLALLWVGLPLLLAGLVWGGLTAWRVLFLENDFFRIETIEVTTDGSLRRELILEYAEVAEGMNLFEVSLRGIRENLMGVPVISAVQAGRQLPDTLVIEITERVAVAGLSRAGGGMSLAVAHDGHVLGPSSVRASLPVIAGVRDAGLRPGDVVKDPMLAKALEVLRVCNLAELRPDVSVVAIAVDDDEFLELTLQTGERVLMSCGDVEKKLRHLGMMRQVARRRGLNLTTYDMTVERNYVGVTETEGTRAAQP
ncbi:MAG: FtsQ-type POTRA domain-containing protein [Lentisphaerae bacterium]|nr:FtsQ-type POTRA domain-containing protein [Lentisphaerota bacterium]